MSKRHNSSLPAHLPPELRKPFRIQPRIQHYAWGKLGSNSLVARLSGASPDARPHAELWFGTHVNAPSRVRIQELEAPLDDVISRWPEEILGSAVAARFGNELPFLLKVLSIRTALSIQAHPDRALAEQLHAKDPNNYPDRSHKPELGIALTPVSILYGFRASGSIQNAIRTLPELRALIGELESEKIAEALSRPGDLPLRALYRGIFAAPSARVAELCQSLYARLRKCGPQSIEEEWALNLQAEFPNGDVGIFSLWLLNLLHLAPGDAIFVQPNTPHAYLSGDVLECMACSDNVVRAGFTGKFKDSETLLSMLTYDQSEPRLARVTSAISDGKSYESEADEFRVFEFSTSNIFTVGKSPSVEMLFCLEGEGELSLEGGNHLEPIRLETGEALLVPAESMSGQMRVVSGRIFLVQVPGA